MSQVKIAVAMACHNRRAKTLKCLATLFEQSLDHGVKITVFLTDDGSSDDTGEAVRKFYPRVRLLKGDGSLFWNGAMYLALAQALEQNFNFHLWLNDDVSLSPRGLSRLLKTHGEVLEKTGKDAVIVGSFCDPVTGYRTYGGQRRASRWHPLRFEPVYPGKTWRPCHTFQGNGVLIPASAIHTIGIIDQRFSRFQGIGDTDYGLRATREGISIYTAPEFIGECELNLEGEVWNNTGFSLGRRWRLFKGPKGIQAKNYLIYAHRHSGPFWFFFWAVHMLKALPGLFFPRACGR